MEIKTKKRMDKKEGYVRREQCAHIGQGVYVRKITINARTTTHNCVEKY